MMTEKKSFLAAAQAVLQASGRPMTSQEITEEALGRSLIETAGKTPQKTMDAQLYTHAKRPEAPIVRVYEPGEQRARRGSVRWALRES
jgi:hypothetical protein